MKNLLYEWFEAMRMALLAIRANKMRSLLTTLGIVIGIVSVTAMFTTINGIERGFDRSLAMLGQNVLRVEQWPWSREGGEWWEFINRPRIQADLARDVRVQSRLAEAVAPVASSSQQVEYQDRVVSGVDVQGSEPTITRIQEINLTGGRYYTELDAQTARNVGVIGADVAEELFPVAEPVGKEIRLGGHRILVIGVLARQGMFLGTFSFDNQIQIPLSTFEKLFGTQNRSLTIQVKAPSDEMMDRVEDEVTGIVRTVRGLEPSEENNFAINRQEAFRAQFATAKAAIYGIGLFLTGLALLVGGIGVMNIMFVSVKERTKEIGLRKAVGAPRRAILTQFLVEAIFISGLGGLIGIGASVGVTAIINSFFTAQLSTGIIAIALAICVGVGVVFGFVPARTAARQNPVDALRYE